MSILSLMVYSKIFTSSVHVYACVPPVEIEQSVETLYILEQDTRKGKENNKDKEIES